MPRSLFAVGASLAVIALACSSGGSGDPSNSATDGVLCHQLLQYGCCGLSPDCVDRWSDATVCASWPNGVRPSLYAEPCDGFVALSVAANELRLYDQTSGYLVAIVDTGDTPVCELGPPAIALTAACLATWQASPGATCTAGAANAAPLVLCPPAPDDAGADAETDAPDDAPFDDDYARSARTGRSDRAPRRK